MALTKDEVEMILENMSLVVEGQEFEEGGKRKWCDGRGHLVKRAKRTTRAIEIQSPPHYRATRRDSRSRTAFWSHNLARLTTPVLALFSSPSLYRKYANVPILNGHKPRANDENDMESYLKIRFQRDSLRVGPILVNN